MQFSDLEAEFDGPVNALYERVHALGSSQRRDLIDLVRGSPHDAGIFFPQDILERTVRDALEPARLYRPDSLGQEAARRAIADYADNAPGHIVLTPGTSVSYWYLFRLLAGTGGEILCPTPSYPLFDYIARMSGVDLASYRLDETKGWRIDLGNLEAGIGERTRAIVLISPHNPTGMVADGDHLERLADIARRHGLAIISDEVFREFTFDGKRAPTPAGRGAPLVFALNGFSKMFALPGLKIGWISVSGEEVRLRRAMKTLEMISDTFLPVNEIAQFAVAGIFAGGGAFLAEYKRLVALGRDIVVDALGGAAAPAGGFYLVLPVHRDIDDENLAIELLDEEHVLVHPGYFYDIEGRHLVFSFLGDPARLREGVTRIARHL